MSAVVFLLVCFLSCSVSEELQRIQNVTADPGDDVTLPCKAPNNVNIAAVQWSRSDLDPNKHVYLKRDGRPETADQDPSYVNRVQLKYDEMKNGDLSLILKNVTNNDEGRYECRSKGIIGRRKRSAIGGKLISTVILKVKEPQRIWITAEPGDNVTLSCKAPNVTIAAVEWIRSDLKRYVYLNTTDQDPSYKNRVQLKDDEMKNGELSLILKNVNNNDEGRYECRYKEGRGGADQRKLISIVHLKVTDLLMTAHAGDDVTLPCQAPNNVTIAAVKWIRSYPNPERLVYLKIDGHLNTTDQDPSYENRTLLKDDEMKSGELSLILKNVTDNDEGRYECLYKGERKVSSVYLIVGAQLIKADPGRDVTLPCQAPNNVTIATVEWIRSGLNRSDPERYVYLKSDGHPNTADQDPSYMNRVQLKDDEMKNGTLSLILKNVKNNDEGRYECLYKEGRAGKKMKLISIVYLHVHGSIAGNSESGKDKRQHLGVILTVALIAALVM